MSGALTLFVGLLLATAASAAAAADSAADGGASDIVVVFDASGSMRAKIGGQTKLDVARRVLRDVVGTLPAGAQAGVVAYGHRSETDCADIETIVPLGSGDRAALLKRVDALPAKGKTPISGALTQVFKDLATRERPATVVLVSDGIETCGGDPCETVRAARAAGGKFVLHVVGFDLAAADVSQLECAAQAGGGLYLGARDAKELGAALSQAVALTPATPSGRLVVKATSRGALVDGLVEIRKAGQIVPFMTVRTYANPATNPRSIPLPDGRYDVRVKAVDIKGLSEQQLELVAIENGATVERNVILDTGQLRVKVTRNGELSDAIAQILRAGTSSQIASVRTFYAPDRNPATTTLPAGVYDIVLMSNELADHPKIRWDGVVVGTQLAERTHDFPAGSLRISTKHGERPIESLIEVKEPATGKVASSGRTHGQPDDTYALLFKLTPGAYRVAVTPLEKADGTKREMDVTLTAGGKVEEVIDFAAP